MRISIVIILMFLLALILTLSCSNGPVGPDREKSPREYTWTRDTIGDGSYQSMLSDLWGTSQRDVYCVGYSNFDWVSKRIWHFDGTSWNDISSVYFSVFGNDNNFSFSPERICGFSPNDVWIVGDRDTTPPPAPPFWKGFVLHLSGSTWSGYWLPSAVGHTAVWGLSSTDLWVGGWVGQMFHFDGSSWTQHDLPDSTLIHHIEGISSNEVYVSGIWFPAGSSNEADEKIHYFRWDGSKWNVEESHSEPDPAIRFTSQFTIVDGQIWSNNATSVTRRISKDNWEILFTDDKASFAWIKAFNPTNIVVFGDDVDGTELVYHYNGQDWARLDAIRNPNSNVTRAWWVDNEMFFISTDFSGSTYWNRSYVIRGK